MDGRARLRYNTYRLFLFSYGNCLEEQNSAAKLMLLNTLELLKKSHD